MRHPSQAKLALFAGGDLGRFDGWRVTRHVNACAECRADAADFSALRAEVSGLNDMPDISWSRLAAEMKANIRLGVEAGECVAALPGSRKIYGLRGLIACGSLAALLVASVLLQSPSPHLGGANQPDQAVAEVSGNGIQVKEGGKSFGLTHGRASDVNYSASAQGIMRDRYVDADSGQVTINDVYVQ
jgi:hypothetical protein